LGRRALGARQLIPELRLWRPIRLADAMLSRAASEGQRSRKRYLLKDKMG